MAGNSKSVVLAALIANGAIAVMKFVGYLLTASPSMLSETYHSISDTGNQVFLLIGIRFGAREADEHHPFGYGKAQFFYSFLVSVLLFGIAGWESAKHGYEKLTHHGGEEAHGAIEFLGFTYEPALQFPTVYVNYAVLIGAIVFEAWAFYKAYTEINRQMERHDWETFREAFRKTSDVTTLTALTEDFIALSGAGIALFGVFLTEETGDPIYDAGAALLIGLLLMGFAIALAWENKRLLLGESLPNGEEQRLRDIAAGVDGVDRVVDLRTVFFGPRKILVTADVEFDPDLDTAGVDDRITAMEEAMIDYEPGLHKIYIEPER